MRDAQPTHHRLPLTPIDVHQCIEPWKSREQGKDRRVLKTRVLAASKTLGLRVANMYISNRVWRKSVGGEDQS